MGNTAVTGRSRKGIRNRTKLVRSLLGLNNSEYVDIVRILENNPFPNWTDYEFLIEDYQDMGSNHGLTTGHSIRIREDIYEGAVAGKGRDRFTLAHELAHACLHANDPVQFARGRVPTYKDPEWQANVFAGELLIPSQSISGKTAIQIAREYGVTVSAANVQLKAK